jgi:hypothetical protein
MPSEVTPGSLTAFIDNMGSSKHKNSSGFFKKAFER